MTDWLKLFGNPVSVSDLHDPLPPRANDVVIPAWKLVKGPKRKGVIEFRISDVDELEGFRCLGSDLGDVDQKLLIRVLLKLRATVRIRDTRCVVEGM